MNFLKTSSLSLAATLVKIGSGFAITKLIAWYGGAGGLALAGQFANLFTVLTSLANGSIHSGVVKYAAEYADNAERRDALFSSVVRTARVGVPVVALLTVLTGPLLNRWLFDGQVSAWLLAGSGLLAGIASVGVLITALQNGLGAIRAYALTYVIGPLLAVALAGLVLQSPAPDAALLAIVAPPVLIAVTGFLLSPDLRRLIPPDWRRPHPAVMRNLLRFSAMALVWNLTNPVSQLVVRAGLVERMGLETAGLWQALTKLSEGYLGLLTSTLSVYFLPALSRATTTQVVWHETRRAFGVVAAVMGGVAVVLLGFGEEVATLLFRADFRPMTSLFPVQLLGDLFRILTWVLLNSLIANANWRAYACFELGFGLSYLLLVYVLIRSGGVLGVCQAYALNYAGYFVGLGFYVKTYLRA